jgi:hypothetical protein
MKIKVDRIFPEDGKITFVMHITQPDDLNFKEQTSEMVKKIADCRKFIDEMDVQFSDEEEWAHLLIKHNLNDLHAKLVMKTTSDFDNEVECLLTRKMDMIRQEIINWLIASQTGDIKPWLDELYQRRRYYFDNDPEMTAPSMPQASEHEEEEEEDEETEY